MTVTRTRLWLLLPHAAAIAAFLAAFGVMEAAGSNRTDTDLFLAIVGGIAALLAVGASLAAAILHPWRHATGKAWTILALHAAALALVLFLASDWMGAHIA